jgi:hypothetical protein
MTAFPSTYPVSRDSYSVVPDDGSIASRADSGKLRIRRLYANTTYVITFQLVRLLPVDLAALESFYATNRLSEIEWTDPYTSVVYVVQMTSVPRVVKVEGAYNSVRIEMEGVRQ